MASTDRVKMAGRGWRTPLGLRGSGTWARTSSRQREADMATDSSLAATAPVYPLSLLPPISRSERPWGCIVGQVCNLPLPQGPSARCKLATGQGCYLLLPQEDQLPVVLVAVEVRLRQRGRRGQLRPLQVDGVVVAAQGEPPAVAGGRPAAGGLERGPRDAALNGPAL